MSFSQPGCSRPPARGGQRTRLHWNKKAENDMSEEKNETLADKAKAQIDALKTKEGREALKEKAKEGLANKTAAVKSHFESLKTKEGRSQFVAKIKTMPLKQKIIAGAISVLVIFCLIRLPACLFGASGANGVSEGHQLSHKLTSHESDVLGRFVKETSLRHVSHVHVKPEKGKLYLNDGAIDRMRIISSQGGMLLAVPVGQNAETFLFQGIKNENTIFGEAFREAERVTPILIDPCEEYSDGEFLQNRLYEYLGTKEVELKSGSKALRYFRECSTKDTKIVTDELYRQAKAKTDAWLAEHLFPYDIDMSNHVFIPKSMRAAVNLGANNGWPVWYRGEEDERKSQIRAYTAARKANDLEAARVALGISETASTFECEEKVKPFTGQKYNYSVWYADENAVRAKGGSCCLMFAGSAMAIPSAKAQFEKIKQAAEGKPNIDKGHIIEMFYYHVFVNPRDRDVPGLLKKLSAISDDLKKGGTIEERKKFFLDTVKAYMDSH